MLSRLLTTTIGGNPNRMIDQFSYRRFLERIKVDLEKACQTLSDPSISKRKSLSGEAGGERWTELALPRCPEHGAIKEGQTELVLFK